MLVEVVIVKAVAPALYVLLCSTSWGAATEPCAQRLQAVPSFDPETSTIHMGQGTDTERSAPIIPVSREGDAT